MKSIFIGILFFLINSISYSQPTNNALEFDGVDDYIEILASPQDLGISDIFTATIWFKQDSQWSFLVMNKSTTRIYINGEFEYEIPTGITFDETSNIRLVYLPYFGYFKGLADELRIWNFALSEQQITEYMNIPLEGDEQGLVGYWPFDESDTDTLFDRSSNNNIGLLGGGNRKNQPIRVQSNIPISEFIKILYIKAPSGILQLGQNIIPQVVVQNISWQEVSFKTKFLIHPSYSDSAQSPSILPGDSITVSLPSWQPLKAAAYTTTSSISYDGVHVIDQKTGRVVVSGEIGPEIHDINPSIGVNGGVFTISITGKKFKEGITARLIQHDDSEIIADSAAIQFINSSEIKVNFNLQEALEGDCHLKVLNPDGNTFTYYEGFKVIEFEGQQLTFGNWEEFKVAKGTSIDVGVNVPSNINDLFVLVKKTTHIGYSGTWAGSIKLFKQGQEVAYRNGNSDFEIHIQNPESGWYTLEIYSSDPGDGLIKVCSSIDNLSLGQWKIGTILRPYGWNWMQLDVPANQQTLYLETEGFGLWSTLDIYYDYIGNNNQHWQLSNMGAGYHIEEKIANPIAGRYYLRYMDSAVMKGTSSQTREYMIIASNTAQIPTPETTLKVTSIIPKQVANDSLVTISIYGSGFNADDVAILVGENNLKIISYKCYCNDSKTILYPTFDLSHAPTGEWELVIKKQNGDSLKSEQTIVIESVSNIDLQANIQGRKLFRIGRQQSYQINLINNGNTNAEDVIFIIFFPKLAEAVLEMKESKHSIDYIPELQSNESETEWYAFTIYRKMLIPKQNLSAELHLRLIQNINNFQILIYAMQTPDVFLKTLSKPLYVKNMLSQYYSEIEIWFGPINLNPLKFSLPEHTIFKFPQESGPNVLSTLNCKSFNGCQAVVKKNYSDIKKILEQAGYKKCNECTQNGGKYYFKSKNEHDMMFKKLTDLSNSGLYFKYSNEKPKGFIDNNGNFIPQGTINCRGLFEGIAEFLKIGTNGEGVIPDNKEDYGLMGRLPKYFNADLPWYWDFLNWYADPLPNGRLPDASIDGTVVGSSTPEDKYGPEGYDPPDTTNMKLWKYILKDKVLSYNIDFWNKEDATAPAQEVFILDTLDRNFADNTFSFNEFGFLKWKRQLNGGHYFNVKVDMRPDENLIVNVEGKYDQDNREISWIFRSLDPQTGQLPEDHMAGFLPQIDSTGYQIGWVSYSVKPIFELTTGAKITNQAWVNFDRVGPWNPAPKEGPWINTIDADPPISYVNSATQDAQSDSIIVEITGQDIGSGITHYSLYVSENNSPYSAWISNTQDSIMKFQVIDNHVYRLYSIAKDGARNVEVAPDSFDVIITDVKDKQNGSLPKVFSLYQNYPNPFNQISTIKYDLPKAVEVKLVVYNILGQKVRTLIDKKQLAGYHLVDWNGQNDLGLPVASGIYLYRIETKDFIKTRKMLLLK